MTEREALKGLRPLIPTIVEQEAMSAEERFQNEVLRPILKFQHGLLVAMFRQYVVRRKNQYDQLPAQKKPQYIEDSIRKDLKFKNLLLGTIIGHFTEPEYRQFVEMEKELSRRLTDLLIQRLQNGL